jgi:hypothetical protein
MKDETLEKLKELLSQFDQNYIDSHNSSEYAFSGLYNEIFNCGYDLGRQEILKEFIDILQEDEE